MAEERLIDDDLDKDRKYKIRKNADGEDELYFDEQEEGEAEESSSRFEVPDFGYDDEEAAILTPEQLAERERLKREEEKNRAEKIEELLKNAEDKCGEKDFSNALYYISLLEEIDGECGKAYFIKFRALTAEFSDFSRTDDLKATSEKVKEFCTEEEREQLKKGCAALNSKVEAQEEHAAELHVENEKKKEERREVFAADARKSLIWFSVTALPFALFLVLTAAFGSVLFAYRDGRNVILTIVFASLAAIFFIATLFTAHRLWDARKKLSLNQKNSSTKLGREYEAAVAEIEKYRSILNDLS